MIRIVVSILAKRKERVQLPHYQLKAPKPMPASFEKCRAEGGHIKTKSLSGGRYVHICVKSGKSYPGYVKNKVRSRYKK